MKADVIMQSAAVYSEPNIGNMQEDQRTLQIALELSNLGLLGTCEDDGSTASFDDAKNKKSQNMTECVPVPSSEHVAEIVGRQGCKIKALRAKTNTYIKTPVRGEEPVFVVTGRKEDVAMARREVQSAAEHFTQIRASRNRHAALMNGHAPTTDAGAGTITLQVRVPYRVVGLVVGPKGATIKRIQQQTHTYIVTPSRDKEPVFEVTGLPENVEKAKEEIEAHIAARTGTQQVSIDDDFRNNGTEVDGPSMTHQSRSKEASASAALLGAGSVAPSAFIPYSSLRSQAPSFVPSAVAGTGMRNEYMSQINPMPPSTDRFPGSVSGFSYNSSFDQADNLLYTPLQSIGGNQSWSTGQPNQLDNANNSVTQFPFAPLRSSSSTGSSNGFSPTSSFGSSGLQRLSPTLSDPDFPSFSYLPNSTQASHNPVRRVCSDSVESTASSVPSLDLLTSSTKLTSFYTTTPVNIESGYSSGGTTDSLTSGSPTDTGSALKSLLSPRGAETNAQSRPPQHCIICWDSSVSAALVPCGHNHFCLGCANKVVSRPGAVCPCCNKAASMALLIKK